MKTIRHSLKLQRGVASLFTAIVLLICITLVALFTSKTVLMETKMTAEDYRTTQATTAAQAALDRGFAYFGMGVGTADQDANGSADYVVPAPAYSMPSEANCPAAAPANTINVTPFAELYASGSQGTLGLFYFVTSATYDHDSDAATNPIANPCDCAAENCLTGTANNIGMIVAKGWSDDCTAVRTITQCINFASVIPDKGPAQPFVSRGSIGVAGNATLINRYTNSNIWTGEALTSAGAAFATYLRPANVPFSSLTKEQKNAGCPNPCNPGVASNNVRLISNTKAGYGVDVIGGDPSLANLTADETFALFYGTNTKNDVKAAAAEDGQVYTNIADAAGKEGTIWIEGSGSLPTQVGTPTSPVIMIVNGNVTIGANSTFYGVIYVIGTLTVNGSPQVFGSIVSESGAVNPSGSPTIVFVPMGGDDNPPPPGTPVPVSGSWKDW